MVVALIGIVWKNEPVGISAEIFSNRVYDYMNFIDAQMLRFFTALERILKVSFAH